MLNFDFQVVPMHHRGHPMAHLQPKEFSIFSDGVSVSVPCSAISAQSHGVCVHYIDEFNEIQASKCFGLPDRPIPNISGKWSSWEPPRVCQSPCSLIMLGNSRVDVNVDYINGQSEWSFRQRTCSNPHQLGKGKECMGNNLTSNGDSDFEIFEENKVCDSPWKLATNSEIPNFECGTVNPQTTGGVIFSPAPWRCDRENEVSWVFECENCDYFVLDVLHFGTTSAEGLYITEMKPRKNETFKIDSVGVTQHQTQRAKITFKRDNYDIGCGFALKISFNEPMVIPSYRNSDRNLTGSDQDDSVAANFGLWGILLCSGFLLVLVVASIFNCRSDGKDDQKSHDPAVVSRAEFEQYDSISQIPSGSPTKIRPNAACFSLAQQQLRLMKAEGKHEGKIRL